MALEDFLESEVGIAVAATALVLSPQVRGWLRKGAVYVLASGIRLGDAVSGAAQGVAQQAQQATSDGATSVQQAVTEAPATARSGRTVRPKPEA